MKKREIIYLHGLLAEVRRHLARRGDLPAHHFEAYEEYGVAPTAIHRTKGDHEEAVRRLLDGLVAALGLESVEDDPEQPSIASQ